MEKSCDCKDYQENIKKLNAMIEVALAYGFSYHGKYFRYCPWCAKELGYFKEHTQ